MSDSVGSYWCYQCQQEVNPSMEMELKCPLCDQGFIEEMESRGNLESVSSNASNRSLSPWTPLMLDLVTRTPRRSRHRTDEEEEEEEEDQEGSDQELEDFLQQHRRNSSILQLLHSLRDDLRSETDNMDGERERRRERRRERQRERERVRIREGLTLINPFTRSILLRESSNGNDDENQESSNNGTAAWEYFLGPGLDLLLQHLTENDPNRYGTPPAKKEAIDALPTVKIAELTGCSICLDDFGIGTDAKEMPCKHKFHCDCILPWLELHSSCPICRFQLPADESKAPNGSTSSSRMVEGTTTAGGSDVGDGRGDSNRFWLPVPWPFNGLFSLPRSESGGNSSSNTTSSPSNTQGSPADEAS